MDGTSRIRMRHISQTSNSVSLSTVVECFQCLETHEAADAVILSKEHSAGGTQPAKQQMWRERCEEGSQPKA